MGDINKEKESIHEENELIKIGGNFRKLYIQGTPSKGNSDGFRGSGKWLVLRVDQI